MMHKLGDAVKLGETAEMDPLSRGLLIEAMALEGASFVGFGLRMDGVPCNWDRTKSAETVSIDLPGITREWRNLHVPVCAIPHEWMGPNTWDDIMEVIAWSFRHMYHGTHPSKRHDESLFTGTKPQRRKNRGKALKWNAVLTEGRGDWKAFAETFHLPKWNHKTGICWSCTCKLEDASSPD